MTQPIDLNETRAAAERILAADDQATPGPMTAMIGQRGRGAAGRGAQRGQRGQMRLGGIGRR